VFTGGLTDTIGMATAAAPPATIEQVPRDQRADETFGWGLSGVAWFCTVVCVIVAVVLVLGALGVMGKDAPVAEMIPGLVIYILLGPVLLRYDFKRRRERTSLARIAGTVLLYRGGALVGALAPRQIMRLSMNVWGTWVYTVVVAAVCVGSIRATFYAESMKVTMALTGCILVVSALVASPFWLRHTCEFLGFPGDASPRRAFRKRDFDRIFSSQGGG
jgi:hypothetical protein